MRIFWLALHVLFVGCSTLPKTNPRLAEEEEKTPVVSVETALDHIQQSYTLGCVEAMGRQGKRLVYPDCRDRGRKHAETVRQLISQPNTEDTQKQE